MRLQLDEKTKKINEGIFIGVGSGLMVYWSQIVIGFVEGSISLPLASSRIFLSLGVGIFSTIVFMIVHAILNTKKIMPKEI